MKERVFHYERVLLKTFGFVIHAEHPHKFVMSYLHYLEGGPELAQMSWSILNDSMRTTLCVRFRGETIACGAIYMAARRLGIALPESPPWWLVCSTRTEDMVEVVCTMHELYQRPRAQYVEVGQGARPACSQCAMLMVMER